jgi:hypothetical protein
MANGEWLKMAVFSDLASGNGRLGWSDFLPRAMHNEISGIDPTRSCAPFNYWDEPAS